MKKTTVLIAGAGPTGLVLALWLAKKGVPLRIIDKAAGAASTSRATVVHARNLELYHQLGIAEAVISRGLKFTAADLWLNGRRRVRIPLGDLGKGISPYPYVLIFPQDRHEAFLAEQLAALGVTIERGIELVAYKNAAAGIIATLKKADGSEEKCTASYLAGADGAHSAVRHLAGIGFPGGTYEDLYYVADIKAKGPVINGEMNAALDSADFLAVFPMQGEGRVRLIGNIQQAVTGKEHFEWSDVSAGILERLKLEVKEVYWFSTYRVHHRVADRFQAGNVFLLGDAGHIHSPVGGQGMNTGIGDAINLAWKIAAVVQDGASPALLATYEAERIAFARQLVASTDRAFTAVSKRGAWAGFVRRILFPLVLPVLLRLQRLRRAMFRAISQTQIQYRKSALSKGNAGTIKGGDRLPWVANATADGSDNYAPLTTLQWQLHCYGNLQLKVAQLCRERNIDTVAFPWTKQASAAGLIQDALYVVRPDGYIGLALLSPDANTLAAYLAQIAPVQ